MVQFYSIYHFIIIFIFLILPFFFKKINLKFLILLLLILEFVRVLRCLNDFDISKDLSLQLCFIYPFIGVLYLIFKNKLFKDYLGVFGNFFGGLAIIFNDPNYIFSYDVLHLYIYHSLMMVISLNILNEKITASFIPLFGILLLQFIFTFICNLVIGFGANYMFLNTFLLPFNKNLYNINIDFLTFKINGFCFLDMFYILFDMFGAFYYVLLFIFFYFSFYLMYKLVFRIKN